MISEERLRAAAAKSSQLYTEALEQDYDTAQPHSFSPAFEKKMGRLRRRAHHPFAHRALQRVASIALVLLIAGSSWLTVDAEAQELFFGWAREVYESSFVYRFTGQGDEGTAAYTPQWLPEGYEKVSETDDGAQILLLYENGKNQYLSVHYIYAPDSASLLVDAPDVTVSLTHVQNYDAELLVPSDPTVSSALLWTDENGCAFIVDAYLDEAGLLRVANSIYQ